MVNIGKLNRDYGEVATSGDEYPKADFISSGNYKFDVITGGGFARGHITEVHGLEGSGKTTLCLQAVAYAQSEGMACVWVDAERRFNPERAEQLGVDIKKLVIVRPQYGEQACNIMRDMIESEEVDLLVLDSLPALSPRSEIESNEGGPVASQAKMWATFIRKIILGLDKRKTAFVVINQMRENLKSLLGPYAPEGKDAYTFPGGKAQKYHTSNRVEIKKLEKGGEFGYKARFRSVKTSFTKPFLEVETFFDWEKGFTLSADILELAMSKGVITKDGASYFFDGDKVAHGEKKMRELMKEQTFADKVTAKL